jgi:hypothetical protein
MRLAARNTFKDLFMQEKCSFLSLKLCQYTGERWEIDMKSKYSYAFIPILKWKKKLPFGKHKAHVL